MNEVPERSENGQMDALPDLERASRAELQHTLEQLAKANRRLTLLNRIATRLMNDPQASFSDLFEEVSVEIGAILFFYQRVDADRPSVLNLVAASLHGSEEEAATSDRLLAAASMHPLGTNISILELDLLRPDHSAADPFQRMGIGSLMRAPLISLDGLLGVVSFASSANSSFNAADQELVRTFADQLAAALVRQGLEAQLRESEQLYRGAVITGRLASWETNMVTRERIWTKEGLEMFGLDLPNGRGVVGGEHDEYRRTLHPEDRHLVSEFHRTADEIDSYPAEYRIIRSDGRLMWMSGRGRVIERGPDGRARRVANIVVDVTERKKSEERTKLLIDELNHRVKNTLATVQAIINQTLKNTANVDDIRETVDSRLQALSRSHDLLTRENWESVQLRGLIEQALQPFRRSDGDRNIQIDGKDVRVRPKAALSLGMALHELATNAAKYGALSVPSGNVRVSWVANTADGSSATRLTWSEYGGPLVVPPTRRGFGTGLIERGLAHDLGGEVKLDFRSEGLCCTIDLPDQEAGEDS